MEITDGLTMEKAEVQNTDKQQADRMRQMESLLASEQEKNLVFHALGEVYFAIYHIKMKTLQMTEITVRDSVDKNAYESADVGIALERFLQNLVVPEDYSRMKQFLDLSTLDNRMGDDNCIAEEYRSVTQGWCRFAFIASARDEQGNLTDLLATVQKIGKEKEAKNRERRHHLEIQQKQLTVIRGLSAEYYSVVLVDYQKDSVEIYRDELGYGKGIGELFSSFHTWSEGLHSYAENLVVDGKNFFYNALSCEELARRKEDYSLNYKKIGEGGFQYLQIKVVYVELSDGYRIAVIGTKNIDAQVRHEEHQKALLREALELEKKQKIELANSHIRLQAALEEAKQYRHAVLTDAFVVYEANLTKNLLEQDIIEEYRGERVSIVNYLGLSVPCSYEQFTEVLGKKQVVEEDIPLFRTKLSRQYLFDLYEQGKTEDVAEFGVRITTGEILYIKNTVYLTKTESACVDNQDSIAAAIRELRDAGFIIELDDFGTGYTSLTTLNSMDLDVIKLDMSLVRSYDPNSERNVMDFSVQLAKMLKLKTVAEGVETLEQKRWMQALGVDYIQGYYYSRPLPKDEFIEYLNRTC